MMIFEKPIIKNEKLEVSFWHTIKKKFIRCKRFIYVAPCGQKYVKVYNNYITIKKVLEGSI